MGKKLHLDMAAEREANDIGKKFMNSSDVVGDMSRAYGADLSSVKIHTDAGAAEMAAQRGVDAFSTGKDVFFGQGIFRGNDPASRGLLAHELSHSMQQGIGGDMGAMQQSAPVGAEQGGILDIFRKKNKRPEEMTNKERMNAGYGYMEEYRPLFDRLNLDEGMTESIQRLDGDEREWYINAINNMDTNFQTAKINAKESGDKTRLYELMNKMMVFAGDMLPIQGYLSKSVKTNGERSVAGAVNGLVQGIYAMAQDEEFESDEYKEFLRSQVTQSVESYSAQLAELGNLHGKEKNDAKEKLLADPKFRDFIRANGAIVGYGTAKSVTGKCPPNILENDLEAAEIAGDVWHEFGDVGRSEKGSDALRFGLHGMRYSDFDDIIRAPEQGQQKLPESIWNPNIRRKPLVTRGTPARKHHFRRWLNK